MLNQVSFQVEDIFSIMGRGIVVTGQLSSGFIKKGMKTVINGKQSEILSIESKNQSLESLNAGTPAGLLLSNIKKDDIVKGNILSFQ